MAEKKKDRPSDQEKQVKKEKKRQQQEFLNFYGLPTQTLLEKPRSITIQSNPKAKEQLADKKSSKEPVPSKSVKKPADLDKSEQILNFFGLFAPNEDKDNTKKTQEGKQGKVSKRNGLFTTISGKDEAQNMPQRTSSQNTGRIFNSRAQPLESDNQRHVSHDLSRLRAKEPSGNSIRMAAQYEKDLNDFRFDEPSSLIDSVISDCSKVSTEKIIVTNVPINIVKKKPGEDVQSQNLRTGELVFEGRDLKWFQIPEEKDSLLCIKTTQHEAFVSDPVSKRLYYYGRITRNSQSNRIFDSRGILLEREFTYVGEFEKGAISGRGVRVELDLCFFDGVWKNGQKLYGTLYHVDGSVLESGEYNPNGKLEGKECLLRLENNEIYIGETRNGKAHGTGCQYYANVVTVANDYKLKCPLEHLQLGAIHFKGCWENGEKDGLFQVYSSEGQFVQEKRYEKGVEVLRDDTLAPENDGQKGEEQPLIDFEIKLKAETKTKDRTRLKNKITIEEVEKILTEELSSKIMSYYINHISRLYWEELWQGKIADPQILILEPEIVTYMREKPIQAAYLRNYTKRFTLPTEKGQNTCLLIFDVFKRIFLPINIANRWSLAEVYCEDKNSYKLLIYDLYPSEYGNSDLCAGHQEHLEILYDYLQFEINDKCKDTEIADKYVSKFKKEWTGEVNLSNSQQVKATDCGTVYLLFLKSLFEDKDFSEPTAEQTAVFKKELYEIAKSKLDA